MMRDGPELVAEGPATAAEAGAARRPLGQSLSRGFLCRCPQCGEGKLFKGYLRSVDACAVCGERFADHRADDLPPYLTVFIVGHVVVALFMALDDAAALSLWTNLAIFVPLTVVLSLALLRPLKGATIGLQWAKRMHGFGDSADDRDR